MTHLFIADLHLSAESVTRNLAFLRFLEQEASQADSLYILGDLFDFWVGDDDLTPFHLSIIQGLRALSDRGVSCSIIHGNRDFMLGQRFAALSGVRLLEHCSPVRLAQHHCLLLHGDLLCTDDKGYQRFRRIMHCKPLQRLFLCLPLKFRRKIGQSIRGNSEMANQKKSDYLLDVNQAAILDYANDYQVDTIIHGHTHRPLQQDLQTIAGRKLQRIVLGCWENEGWVLKIDPLGEITQRSFQIEAASKKDP